MQISPLRIHVKCLAGILLAFFHSVDFGFSLQVHFRLAGEGAAPRGSWRRKRKTKKRKLRSSLHFVHNWLLLTFSLRLSFSGCFVFIPFFGKPRRCTRDTGSGCTSGALKFKASRDEKVFGRSKSEVFRCSPFSARLWPGIEMQGMKPLCQKPFTSPTFSPPQSRSGSKRNLFLCTPLLCSVRCESLIKLAYSVN